MTMVSSHVHCVHAPSDRLASLAFGKYSIIGVEASAVAENTRIYIHIYSAAIVEYVFTRK